MGSVKVATLTFLMLFLVACNVRFFSPSSPSPTSDSGLILVDTPEGQVGWSPYIVVQPDGGATEGYRKALTALAARGNVRGVRLGLSNYREPNSQMISSLGIEISIGGIPNESLFDPNPEAMIDRYISLYPEVRVFQLGNEVTTINSSLGLPKMTIEQYMEIFKRIYNHTSVVLMTQSTFGSGFYGSNELKRMVELGLTPNTLSPQRVIVGINIYSEDALNEYVSTRNQYLGDSKHGGYRVWVTETGSSSSAEQIAHVGSFSPRLTNALSAERIYWYVLWDGDALGEDYGLIRNAHDPANMTYSPLFKALAGIQ